MSVQNVKAQLQTALQAVTWTIPASASGITHPTLRTTYGRVDTQQFAGEEGAVPSTQWPFCRIWLPAPEEHRVTSGGDSSSYKDQRFQPRLFIYQGGLTKDWQGLGDYFDAVIDATLAYFRTHSAPQGQGPVTQGQNDLIRAWGLRLHWQHELPIQTGAEILFRATIIPDVVNVIV